MSTFAPASREEDQRRHRVGIGEGGTMDGTKLRRARACLLMWVVVCVALLPGLALAQASAGAIPDGRGRVVAVAAGGYHSCALRSSGSIACWGSNWSGESSAPTKGLFTAVAAGLYHSCALRSDGEAVCWGDNGYGQVAVPVGQRFTAIAAGGTHTCGLRASGAMVCWGNNAAGQATPIKQSFVALTAGVEHTCGLRADGAFPTSDRSASCCARHLRRARP
jgi:hypothetical protein